MTSDHAGDLPSRMPHDGELERAALGAAMLDATAARTVVGSLRPADFWHPTHRAIFRAVVDLVDQGNVADLPSVTAQLRDSDQLTAAGGAAYVSGMLDVVADVIGVETHVKMLRELAARRRALEVLTRATTAVQLGHGLDHVGKVADDLAKIVGAARPVASVLEERWHPVGLEVMTTPPPPRDWLFRQPDGPGLLPRGRVGLLSAAGGTGKTHVLLAAAVAVVTGRRWLGHFQVDERAVGGKVLLLLGEEEHDEVHRRLSALAERLRLSPAERQECADRIVAVPLAGVPFRLTESRGGELVETRELEDLRRRLAADGGGWALVAVDPLSRFAGGDVELSTEAATRFLQAAESLTHGHGSPTVLVATHSSKNARRQAGVDVRGVTGLTDAARWVATLKTEDRGVVFEQAKSNYSLPMEPLHLRWVEEVLAALDPAAAEWEARRAEHQRVEEMSSHVVAVLRVLEDLGRARNHETIRQAAGIRKQAVGAALDVALARGLVRNAGTGTRPVYELTEAGSDALRAQFPPYPPREPGTGPSEGTGSGSSGGCGTDGNQWEPGSQREPGDDDDLGPRVASQLAGPTWRTA